MAFNPNLPATGSPILSAELRSQFNALNDGTAPIGCVLAYLKSFPNAPALPPSWAECNGQVLNDPSSPFHGQMLPDLNVSLGRFLRGSATSGTTGGIDSFGTAMADNSGSSSPFAAVSPDFSPGAAPFPPYYEVVWVMRVK